MKMRAIVPALLIAGLMIVSLFAVCGTAAADAGPPQWEEGDSWAMGKSIDLDANFADQIDELQQSLEQMQGVEVNQLQVDGQADFWLIFEVADVNDTHYTLTSSMGQKLIFSADVDVEAQIPAEGTYNYTETPDMVTKSISLSASIDYAMVVNAEASIQKDTMAVETVTLDIQGSAEVDFSADNIPLPEENNEQVTYTHESFDVNAVFDLDVTLNFEFTPALDIFDFPISVGEDWEVNSDVEMSGTIDGVLDVSGLPAEGEQEIFSDEVLQENGITSFPINFDQITVDEEEGPTINNGVISGNGTVMEQFTCTEMTTITHPTLGQISAYVIQAESGGEFYYSPDANFMTSMGGGTDILDDMEIDMPISLPGDVGDDMEGQIDSVDSETAQDEITDIADFQSSLSDDTGSSSGGDDLNSFFFEPPYFGVILGVLVVFVIVAAVVAVVRK